MSQIIILLKFIKFHLIVLKTTVGKIVKKTDFYFHTTGAPLGF